MFSELKNRPLALISFGILLIGLVAGLILLRFPQLLNPKAGNENIRLKDSSGNLLPEEGGMPVTDSLNIQIELVPPAP